MRRGSVPGAVSVVGLMLGTALAVAAALNQGGDATELEAHRANLAALSRDGSWWHAGNAEYLEADGDDAPDAYATRFWVEPGGISAGGCLWSIRDGHPVGVHWRFYTGWDEARGLPFFYQVHTSGTITGMGYLTERDGQTTVMEQQFKSTDGDAIERVRHRSDWPDADTQVTHSTVWSTGEWRPRRTYTWTRRTSGPVPCGPER